MFNIRKADLDDLNTICTLRGKLILHQSDVSNKNLSFDKKLKSSKKLMETYLSRDYSLIYIAFDNQVPVGFIHGTIDPLGKTDVRGYIQDFFVESNHRCKGIGSKLLETIESWFNSNNVDFGLSTDNTNKNKSTIDYYLSRGYTKYKEDDNLIYLKKSNSREILILIPPSEGKQSSGNSTPLKKLNSITEKLLHEISNADPVKLYGLKDKALNEAIKINAEISVSKTLPAIERYSGVVYKAIEYGTIENKLDFDSKVRIVSALFGLVKPKDLVPNYKLKIDKLNSAKLWSESNSKKIKNNFIFDLLPKAHKKAVSYSNGISIEFVILKNDKLIPAGHNGKYIKGKFVRWLIETSILSPFDLSKFKEDGFYWDGEKFVKKI